MEKKKEKKKDKEELSLRHIEGGLVAENRARHSNEHD